MSLWYRLRESRVLHNLFSLPLLLTPYWIKWPRPPHPFDATYVMGFVLSSAMLLAIVLWLILGMPGIVRFLRRPSRFAWAILWGLFIFWALITQTWAFVEKQEPGVAQNFALQMALVGGYAIVLACSAASPRFVLALLTLNGVISALIGGAQVACHCPLGLKALGEVALDPNRSGISVIQGEGLRWLRPYALLPHPNVLAGLFAVSLFAATGLFLTSLRHNKTRSTLPLNIILLGMTALIAWMLLLSISRAAWIGVGIGALAVLAGLISRRDVRRALILLTALMIGLGAVFFMLYRPLIIARTGAGQENTEMRSLADRVVYAEIAQAAIAKAPVLGLGGGNTPWYAAFYIAAYTDYDLQGDHIHNIYLETWGDLGVIGLVLFLLLQAAGLLAVINAYRRTRDIARLMMIGGWVALAIVGLFDHYPWSLVMGQAMWIMPIAAAMSEMPHRNDSVIDNL